MSDQSYPTSWLPGKTVHFETWGCQMNVADSENMMALLAQKQMTPAGNAESADVIVLNTCHIREKAKHKVASRLGRLKDLKKARPDLKIVVSGCVAQAEGRRLLKEVPFIDILVGPGQIKQLPDLLMRSGQQASPQTALGFDDTYSATARENPEEETPIHPGRGRISRFVNIQAGCNNFCTFCVVPFTRGPEKSELPSTILRQISAQIRDGAREITLLGQNVNSYGQDLILDGQITARISPFVDLVRDAAQVPGLKRLRFTTSNPHDFTKSLADSFRIYPALGRYIHLPVQSGSDAVLGRMKRKVTVQEYWDRINWLREAVPDIAISTDLIVGFPGESEEDFQKTMDLVREVGFSFVFAFKYSPRGRTAAARFKDQIPEDVKSRRLADLNHLQDEITIRQNANEVGKTREILVTYRSQKDKSVYYGRTEHFRLVKLPSSQPIEGQVVTAKIIAGNKTALVGDII